MKKPFFARHALLVLIGVFFLVPFAMRGSRYAVQRMKNDVKDWLPSDFEETADLEWFRKRFLGEQFVIISWEGCRGTSDDQQFKDFVDNLFPEAPPSARMPPHQQNDYVYRQLKPNLYVRSYTPVASEQEENFIGNKLSLRAGEDLHYNWGGKREKWIRSGKSDWVYITDSGELWQWTGNQTWPAQLWRQFTRSIWGPQPLQGKFITGFNLQDGAWYHEDPSRLNARLFKSIYSGPSVVRQLTDANGKLNISDEEAYARLDGVLFKQIGEDADKNAKEDVANKNQPNVAAEGEADNGEADRQTCIVVNLTEAAKSDPRALVGRGMLGKQRGALLDIADKSGIQPPKPPPAMPGFVANLLGANKEEIVDDRPMLRLGGPPVDNAAIDEEGQITLARLLGLSLAVGLGLSWLCFRSINITLMVFLVGGFSAVASVGLVYWTGSQLDAVLMSMPSLVYVLGISGAVHVVNYYRESVTETGLLTAPDKSVKLGLWPCTMAAFTTSLGLISLATSNIVPIRKFGIYAAVGVVATLFLLFTFLPAALELFPPKRYLRRSSGRDLDDDGLDENDEPHKSTAKESLTASETHETSPASFIERVLDRFWQRVAHFVIGHYRLVGVLCLLMLFAGSYGVTKIDTDVQLLKLFDSKAKIIEDYEWLEANLGKLVPMEIVIRISPNLFDPSLVQPDNLEDAVANPDQVVAEGEQEKPPLGLDFHERMQISKHVANAIDQVFGNAGLKQLSTPMLASTFAREKPVSKLALKTYKRELEASKGAFVEAGFLRDDPEDDHELWRISLRLAALDNIDFGDFVQRVKRVVEPIMLAYEYRESIVKRLSPIEEDDPPAIYFVGYKPDPVVAGEGAAEAEPAVDQTTLFVSHLNALLLKEGIKKVGNIENEEQLALVRPNDTIILIKDVPGVSKKKLDNTFALRFDARRIAFDPSSVSDRTAWQRKQKISAVYTGLVPIVYKAQRTLLVSLIKSTGLAFLMIAAVMILLLRSPRAGLLSMFPNVFPVFVIFGYMGWRGIKVDIGSMMTASVAMGVAVDDTIHFLSWFRKSLDEGLDRKNAILVAYRRVATAMTQTTAIGGIGLSIFAFSTFTPTQRFGTLMLALLAAALVGDLLFLPALLASSLGKVFDRKPRSPGPQPHLDGLRKGGERQSKRDIKGLPPSMRHDDPHF